MSRVMWGLLLVRLGLGAVYGLVLLVGESTFGWILLLGWHLYLLVDGLVAVVAGLRNRSDRVLLLASGLISILALLVSVLVISQLVVSRYPYAFWLWSTLSGLVCIIGAAGLWSRGWVGWRWLLAVGLGGVLFGVTIAIQPRNYSLLWVQGWYSLVAGAVLLLWALRVRAAEKALAPA